MEQAETADLEGVPFRVVRADHLAVIALTDLPPIVRGF